MRSLRARVTWLGAVRRAEAPGARKLASAPDGGAARGALRRPGARRETWSMTRRVAAYVRVSTQGQDFGSQRAAIELAARARGDKIAKWFHERQSGRSLARPVLRDVRAAARRGELAALYIFRLDRLTRSGVADTFRVVEDLRGAGCNVISVADGLPDTAGPWGDVVLAVLAAVAQIELGAIRERIGAARARARAEGRHWGRRPRLDAKDGARLLELAKSRSVRELAASERVPLASVQRALKRARLAAGGAPPKSSPPAAAASQCTASASGSPRSNTRTSKARATAGTSLCRTARARVDR